MITISDKPSFVLICSNCLAQFDTGKDLWPSAVLEAEKAGWRITEEIKTTRKEDGRLTIDDILYCPDCQGLVES